MSRATVGAFGRFFGVAVCLLVVPFETGHSQTPPPPATPVLLSAGAIHSLAIDPGGAIWSWGGNANGRLGDGTTTSRLAPIPVAGAVGVFSAVSAGGAHSLARRADGRVVAWGANANGAIGDGTTTERRTPVVLAGVTDAVAVAAGASHSLALRSNGSVVAWGANNEGQLGNNSRTRRLSPVAVTGLTNVVAIAAGGVHSLALTATGQVFAWGDGSAGQLGLNGTSDRLVPTLVPSLSGITGISAGAAHSAAVSGTGGLFTWGHNATFQLGDGTQTTRLTPTLVTGVTGVTAVSAGAGHTLALAASAGLYAWGNNLGSQLGDGTTTSRSTPVAVAPPAAAVAISAGGAHSLALATDGSTWAAGANVLGQVGDGSTTTAAWFVAISGPAQTWGVFPPTLAPPGGTFSAPQTLTATTPTAGGTIRFTTTGIDPTATDAIWPVAGLSVAQASTVKVRGFKTGMTASGVTTAVYAFAVNPPIATPPGGTYAAPQTVSLSTSTPGATITYTIDGSEPTEASTVYAAPFVVSSSATLRTRAFRAGFEPSAILSYVYTFNLGTLSTPTAAPSGGAYSAPQTVVLAADPGATIRYTLGGAEPTEASPAYGAPIGIAATSTLKARAFRPDWTPSAVLTASYVIETGGESLPPDPSTVATPINPAVLTDFAAVNAFLYAGPNPIQRGATPSVFEPHRLAIVRGRVLDRVGSPLPGARVTILDHPAYGYTLSRADGVYDLAVNGGASVVVQVERDGYLPVQRRVATAWHDFGWTDDVRLTPLDPVATPVQFAAAAPPQRARGSLMTDDDGPRQATLVVPEGGVHAALVLADGTILPDQAQLTLRATEYTVGAAGPAAMPGPLPPTSGYTYAVDFTADEARAAGAVRVTFDPALIFYIENFLDFPVGGAVPAGSYDRTAGAWLPEQNGRIVRLLSITPQGLAQLDVDGSGDAAPPAALLALGVTDGERAQLADLYPVGQSLWRVPVPHFSPWDYNWPYGPPGDAANPNLPEPERDRQDDDPCEEGGSIIECQNQTLGERLPIAGTPFTLNYRSNRQPGRVASRAVGAAITGPVVPSSLRAVDVTFEVAGQRWVQTYPNTANQRIDVQWDGRDAYGRQIVGARPASLQVSHRYPARYLAPPAFEQSFALPGVAGASIQPNRSRGEVTLETQFAFTLGGPGLPASPVGGWSLDVHHVFDLAARTLYLGDGSRRADAVPGASVRTSAGGGSETAGSTPVPGGSVALFGVTAGVPLPDGRTLIATTGGPALHLLDRAGLIAALPVPAAAEDPFGRRVVVDALGRIFLGEGLNLGAACGGGDDLVDRSDRVRGPMVREFAAQGGPRFRVSELALPGALTTVVEFDLPAESPCVAYPMAADRDGTLFVGAGRTIFRIGPDRIAVPAYQLAEGESVRGLALRPDGAVYVAIEGKVLRFTTGGERQHVAGTGAEGYAGDGGPAAIAEIGRVEAIVARSDGSFIVADAFGGTTRFRRLGPDGLITTVAGGGFSGGPIVEGEPAVGASILFSSAGQLAVAADGALLIPSSGFGRVYRVAGEIEGIGVTGVQLTSSDGAEVYVFDLSGRHLRTHDALLGTVLHAFTYDGTGRLVGIRDRNGLDTVIERGPNGLASAMVGPFGQRTGLTYDPDGYVASVANPAGETVRFAYEPGGLLAAMTTPRNDVYAFGYDALGRLVTDTDPAGGVQTLTRAPTANGWSVTLAHNAGHARTIRQDDVPTGDRQYVSIGRDGATTTQSQTSDGGAVTVSPDGTQTIVRQGPDPRFGMQAPVAATTTVVTPGGLTWESASSRETVLADPANLLSVTSQADTTVINGRLWQQVFDVPTRTLAATTPEGRTTTTVFDAAGRVSQVTVGSLLPVTFGYTPQGQVATVTQGPRTTTFAYDARGRVERVTDPLAREASFAYDLADRVTSQTLPGGRTVGFGYDAGGNVTAVTPPDRPAHGFTHTPVDLPDRYDPPAATPGGPTMSTYRIDRQAETVTRPDGQTIALGYDAAGRPATLTTPTGTTTWTYAPTSGLVTSLASPDTTVGIGYDGSLPTSVTWAGAVTGSVGVTYDNFLRPSGQTVNGGSSVAFTYDLDNLLTGAGGLTIARQPATGLVTGTTLGAVSEARTLNGFGEMAARSFAHGGSPLYSVSYSRDALARIETKTETILGTTHVEAYTYDAAGRLETVTRDGGLVATYGFDANGNRTSTTTSGGPVTATYDAQDRLQQWGSTTYAYTAAGELLTKTEPGVGTTTYTYDVQGTLRQVALPTGTVIDYRVDALNRRIGRLVNGVKSHGWLWAGTLRPVAELDAAGAVVSRFVYGTGINVPDYLVRGGQTYRLVTDHLGSVRLVVNVASGAVVQQLAYDAWGQVTLDTNPGWQPFGFAGGLYDPVTGLVRFGARDYDATTGRWTARDPLAFEWGTVNDYTYARSEPLNRFDPTGGDWVSAASSFAQGVVGGVVGGAVVTVGVASGTVVGAAAAVGAVGYGAYQGTIALQEAILGFDPYTGRPLSTEARLDVAAGLAGGAVGGAVGGAGGRAFGRTGEVVIGARCRIAPFGNNTKHPQGRFPHYHRSVPDPARPGESIPGQGIGRHRPWETKSPDTSWWDRF